MIYVALAGLGGFLAFWLRSEFLDEKNALETAMHLNFVEDLIGLEKTDVKNFLQRKDRYDTESRLTVYDSASDRRITFYQDSFSNELKDSLRLLIKNGIPVWDTKDDNFKIKQIVVQPSKLDSIIVNHPNQNPAENIETTNVFETTSDQFKDRETELNVKALSGILPQTIFALILYSLLILGFYLLQKNHRDQRALLENKNVLIRNITHELQTPIATIAVALEAIQNFNIKEDKVKTNEYINTSRSQLKNLSDSIDRVMQMSKMDDQKEVFHFEKTSIKKLAEEATEDLKLQLSLIHI